MKTSEWFQIKLKDLEGTEQFRAETVSLACEEKIAELEAELASLRTERDDQAKEIERYKGWLKLMVHCYENDNAPNRFIFKEIKDALKVP